jgi:transposase-like protein
MPHPQTFIPIFAAGTVRINADLAYQKEDGQVFYFNGHKMPVFSHAENDVQSFRMIVSQFCVSGNAKQAEIIRTFGIPGITMKRSVKIFRERGPAGFFSKVQPKRKPRVLTPEVIKEVQKLLDEGATPKIVAEKLGLKQNTIEQAIRAGRLKKKSLFNLVR